MSEVSRKCMWAGITLILLIGLIHIIEVPDSFDEAAYKGWLFFANGLGALLAAYGIFRSKSSWGWGLGLLIAAGSFLGYVASRTIGLPGLPAEPDAWLEPLGVASLVAEGAFVILFIKKK